MENTMQTGGENGREKEKRRKKKERKRGKGEEERGKKRVKEKEVKKSRKTMKSRMIWSKRERKPINKRPHRERKINEKG